MRIAKTPIVYCSIFVSSIIWAAKPRNTAKCEKTLRNAPCEAEWNFAESEKTAIRVQAWDDDTASWKDLDKQALSGSVGIRSGALDQGKLFRVIACINTLCDSSNVFWSAAWPAPDDVPNTMKIEFPTGAETVRIQKATIVGEPMRDSRILTQYNMHLAQIEALAFHKSRAEMPEMNQTIKVTSETKASSHIMIPLNVYHVYEDVRRDVLATRQ